MISTLLRFLAGDFVFSVCGGIGALAGWWLSGLIRKRWLRVLVGLLLAGLGVWLAHQGYEAWHTWWVTPLGPHMHLDMP